MSLHTFPTQQLQFISYEGPPEPKQSKYAKKTPAKGDMRSDHDGILNTKPRPNAGQKGRGNSTCTPSGAEVIDLTHSTNEPNRQLSDEREVDDDLLSYDDGLLSKNKCQSTVPKQFVATPTWEDPCDESSNNVLVIEDSQPESEIDENWLGEDDMDTQIDTQPENSCDLAQECRGEEPLAGAEDSIVLDEIDGVGAQASEASHREVTPTPPTGSSVTITEQPTQRTTGHTPMQAKTSQPWRPMYQRKDKDKSAPHESTSSGSDSESNDSVVDHSSNHAIWPSQKRKRSLPAKQRGQTLSMALEQRPQHAQLVAKRRKPFSRGHPPCDGLPVQDRHRDVYTLHREDNCKEYDHVSRQVRSNKRLKPIRHSRQFNEHNRKRAYGGIDNEEYEVAQILEARLHYRKLQYRAKWTGYEPDPVWYAASNFKRSPYKLREFHVANPTRPGPPERLNWWIRCWEQDRDADDHPDDNKPREPRSADETSRQ